jgi:aldehyde dehydrogenase (NAD+)
MNNFNYNITLPLQMLDILIENKHLISQTYAIETSYSEKDIELLWSDLETYLTNFNKAFENKQKMWNLEKTMYQCFEQNSLYIRKNHGKVLICLPYNAVIPLLPIFLISFCVFKNSVILSPSRKTLETTKLILNLFKELFQQNQFNVELFEKGGQKAIEDFVLTRKVDLLFFQGSSKSRNEIYSKCIGSGVELIYEGEGNQITIIDNLTTLETIKPWLSFCNGKLCTTPKILFINSNLFQDFYDSIQEDKTDYQFIVLNENTDINNISDKTILFSSYNKIEEIVSYLQRNYDFGLQVSIFTKTPETIIENLSQNLNISRVTVNMNPTFQNSLLPWGGYKKSGYSRVCDFFDKATKTIIIENA